MFEELAGLLRTTVEELAGHEAAAWRSPDRWQQFRDQSKAVIVILEMRKQEVLAQRVEREYQRFCDAAQRLATQFERPWSAKSLTEEDKHPVVEAGRELSATLSALARFRDHILVDNPEERATRQPGRAKVCRADVERELEQYLNSRIEDFKRLVQPVLAGEGQATEEFRGLFGPTAMARQLARILKAEEKAVKTAIQETRLYQEQIKPLFAKPPQPPPGWEKGSKVDDIVKSIRKWGRDL